MELGVLNINPLVRMTPCPPGLHHQTTWMGGILTGKMTFYKDECLAKIVGCPDHPETPVKTITCSRGRVIFSVDFTVCRLQTFLTAYETANFTINR